jgi:hypothetical protein
VPFLHGVRAAVIKDDGLKEMMEEPGMKQRHKEPRSKRSTTCRQQENIQQDHSTRPSGRLRLEVAK